MKPQDILRAHDFSEALERIIDNAFRAPAHQREPASAQKAAGRNSND